MGAFDFVKDAGASIGIGKSKKEEEAKKRARAKEASDLKKARAEKAAAAKKAAAAAKARRAASDKEKKLKERAAKSKAAEMAREAKKGEELTKYLAKLGIKGRNLNVRFDDGVAFVTGTVANAATKEKVVLAVGNVSGVSKVRETLKVTPAKKGAAPKNAKARKAAAARRRANGRAQTMHTVKSGDTLSKIAKKYLGDAGRYPEIFKANQPMLTDPNKIFPGQVLRIPQK